MSERLTKQGVRDLGGGRQSPRKRCQHFYAAQLVIIGYRYVGDGLGYYEEPVYGRRCMHCGDVK